MAATILSFCVLDDLKSIYEPIHQEIKLSEDEISNKYIILKTIENIFDKIKKDNNITDNELGGWQHFLPIFHSGNSTYFLDNTNYREEISKDLLEKKFWVYNRFEKYYVIAFALNYTRFEVYSKDCDKKLIKWRENDSKDSIANKGIIENENYNENPVISFINAILSS